MAAQLIPGVGAWHAFKRKRLCGQVHRLSLAPALLLHPVQEQVAPLGLCRSATATGIAGTAATPTGPRRPCACHQAVCVRTVGGALHRQVVLREPVLERLERAKRHVQQRGDIGAGESGRAAGCCRVGLRVGGRGGNTKEQGRVAPRTNE